jgi:hypothetical protein
MMAQQGELQERLFYEFRLDEHVPPDHLLRKIDRVLDLSSLHRQLASFYSHTGRIAECLSRPESAMRGRAATMAARPPR